MSEPGSPVENGRYSNSSERGMSVASAENPYRRSAPGACALLLLAVMLGEVALAQDKESGAEEGDPAGEPVERAFVRSTGGDGALAQRHPHLAVWLEPAESPRVLSLVEREATDEPSGAMVILADEGQSANDPLLEDLRARLTRAGWATMTLGLEQDSPALELARQRLLAGDSQRQDADEDEEAGGPVMIDVNDQAAEDLMEAHRGEMKARLASAIDWFTERDYRQVVLVGVGSGAEVMRGYLPDAPQAVARVAWVAANFGPREPEAISDGLTDGRQLPILDLYPSRDQASERRRAAFRRAGVSGYQAIPAPVGVRPEGRHAGVIANRLLGWAGGE